MDGQERDRIRQQVREARGVHIERREGGRAILGACVPLDEDDVISAMIQAEKPGAAASSCAPPCCAPKGEPS